MSYLHTLFERNVLLNPDAIALKFENNQISYADLDAKSNQLANYLIQKKIRPGDYVLICLNRSIEMIVSILGILKAGGTYVPIDPKTPTSRFNLFIEDFDLPILICNSILNFESDKVQHLALDVNWQNISEMPKSSPEAEMDEQFGAVVLYTSGSTGHPKGVLLSHKSLVNILIWDSDRYKHAPHDIVLQHAAYNFDFSILEIFMALANGGKLILARPEFHYESSYLLELIQNEKITKMGSVPSLLQAYINLPTFENCISLKQVFLGGESLKFDLQKNFFLKSKAELINIYGPTEASISVLNWECQRASQDKIIPIGFPVAGMEIFLVDTSNEIIEDDRIGEIYISGVGVATEYFKRPELTKKHFVDFQDKKMFRTFDLGRKLPNGAYQFCGRVDNQVKIRGLRVELEEIEYQLNLIDTIKENVVHVIENDNEQKKIVAYVILNMHKEFDVDHIRKELVEHLPDYMIPSYFIQVDKFELNANGKIDKNKLPLLDKKSSNVAYLPPVNDLQKVIVEVWCKLLKTDHISIIDTIENLGVDSISLLEIHYSLEEKLAIKFPISALSKSTTVLSLSETIEKISEKTNEPQLIQIHRTGVEKTPIVFVGPVFGNANSLSLNLLNKINPNFPFLSTLDITNSNYSTISIADFADIYVNELEKIYPSNVYILGGYSMGGLVALEMISLLHKKGKTVRAIVLVDTYHPTIMSIMIQVGLTINAFKSASNILGDKIKYAFNKQNVSIQPSNLRIEVLEKVFTDSDKLKELALRYTPKKYQVETVNIYANKEESFFSRLWRIGNAYKWNKLSHNKTDHFAVETNHVLILQNPYADQVAHIINEELLNQLL